MKDLAVVIVSYNVWERLEECLGSLFRSLGVSFGVCVVDNASADGSVALVRERYPQALLMESPHNGGYAYGNNLALRQMGYEGGFPEHRYVLLLNPDTRLGPNVLANSVAYMDSHPEAGVMGAKLVREDGSLDLACRRSFPTPEVSFYRMTGLSRLFPGSRRFGRYNLTFLDPDQPAEVDSVCGAFMLVRREALLAAGLLDERFFLYGEDLDWALRIKAAGWSVLYNPAVQVLHYKRESSRRSRKRATLEFYRSMLLFYEKHYAPQTPRLLDWLIRSAIVLRGGISMLPVAFQRSSA